MKEILLPNNQRTIVDDDFCDLDGWYAKWSNHTKSFYVARNIYIDNRRTTQRLHRVILGITDPKIKADHINHDTLDNRKENLRVVNNSQNMWNKRKHKNNSSGFIGVSYLDGRWRARICFKNKAISLGMYDTPEEASAAYQNAAKQYFGDYKITGVA